MKLRSELKAATSSGSFWAEIGGQTEPCLRRSRRLCPALKPAYRDLQALPPSARSRKRKSGGNSFPPEDEAKRPRKEEEEEKEDGFPAPANCGDSESTSEGSGGDLIESAESNLGLNGNEDGVVEEIKEANWGEQDKDTTPPISEVSTAGQGKESTAADSEQPISGEEKGNTDGVFGEQHSETKALSPSVFAISVAEEDCTERVIPPEEEICVVNRSPTYSDVSLDDHRDEIEEMEEDSEVTTNSASVQEEISELTAPPPPSPSFFYFEDTEQVNFSDSFLAGPQLHFALNKGDGGWANYWKPVLKVRDFAAGGLDGGNNGGWCGGGRGSSRRTEIFAGRDYGRKVEVVCLYESLSLPFG